MSTQIKLSGYVMQFLQRMGVDDVFVLSGGGCMHLVDSLGSAEGVSYTCCLHEQAASIAAAAYAQYRNDLGVALVTTGPGGTNAITGVLGAWIDSAPLLILSGQVKRADLKGNRDLRNLGYQEADIISLVKPITKYACTLMDPLSIRVHLEEAVRIAREGRPGPVWLDIPLDVQAAMIDPDALQASPSDTPLVISPSANEIEQAVALIRQATRPVLLLGKGVDMAGGRECIEPLLEVLGVPTLTTWRAMDFLEETHQLYFGRPGCIGQRGANFIQQNADLVISIGARLDYGQIGFDHTKFARAAKKIVVDVTSAEIEKLGCDVALAVVADAKAFMTALTETIGSAPMQASSEWLAYCRRLREAYPAVLPRHREVSDYVNLYALVEALSDAMEPTDVFAPGCSGAGIDVPMQAFQVKAGQRHVSFPGIGSMGYGIPSAIGSCLASGRRRTICTNGDGGFQMNIQELETVRRLGLPIKYFVLHNESYGSIKTTQRNYFDGRYVASDPGSGVTLPDIKKIATAYNLPAWQIAHHKEMRRVVAEVLATPGPVICEVMLDPEAATECKVSSAVRPDGSMVSRPQEDLWPFLPREEFRANMLIDPLPESL